MVSYSGHQLLVLLALVAAFGGGLAIDRWRRAHPDAVERIERFDREAVSEPVVPSAAPEAPVRTSPARPLPVRPPKLRSDAGAPKLRSDAVAPPAAPIELNRATADELTRLPGIGPALAARIIEAREREPFTSIDDLRRVRGVGSAKLERVRPLVSVTGP